MSVGSHRRDGGMRWVYNPLCLILALACSGCATAAPTPEPVTIGFAHPDVDVDFYQAMVDEFGVSHPHITVELHASGGNPFGALGTGDADVLVVSPYALIALQQQGQIISLDPFIEQERSFDLSGFYPGAMEPLTMEGKRWAIPAGVDVLVTFYSRDLFDQHSLPYPEIGWTWDDFLNAGLTITDPDEGIYGYTTTGTMTDPSYFDAVFFIYQHGGRLFDSLQDPSHTTFDDPLAVDAVDWYARLYHEYDIAPTPQEARQAFGGGQYAIYDGLRHGKVGMWFGMLSERGGIGWPVEWFVNWGMAPLPQDVTSITQAQVEGYVIYAETKHPDACWEWITFLSQQMPYRLMPARKALAESSAYGQRVGQDVAAVARASMENAVLINLLAFAEFEGDMENFARAVGEVIDETSTPQAAMDWVQQQTEQ
jgi:multiple sugar transport system substrate-binding protein